MKQQHGLSLIGLLIISAIIIFVALIGFKLLPSYLEYFTVQRVVKDLGNSDELRGATVREVQSAFDRRATIDNITSIRGSELEVTKVGDGFEIVGTWAARVPLFANVSACLDFEAKN
jgi:hypothetical protein